MEIVENKLTPPDQFPFPFNPYPIQQDFMQEMYSALEAKCLCVFESPTGTGKSMSIICSALQWLFDDHQRRIKDLMTVIAKLKATEIKNDASDCVDWLNEQFVVNKAKEKRKELEKELAKIVKVDEEILQLQENTRKALSITAAKVKRKVWLKHKTTKAYLLPNTEVKDTEEKFIDDDLLINDDATCKDTVDDDVDHETEETNDEDDSCTIRKIFLCSRTHSQLSQLAGEIQKSPFSALGVRVASLASRQNLCVNDAVLRLKHLSLINEACQDLRSRKSSTATKTAEEGKKLKKQKSSGGCPFTNTEALELLRGEILTQVLDVEEVSHFGREISACPYYAARQSVKDAHVVLVPYNTLLHRSTREASKIDLKDSIVIVDEAHNLLDTLGNIHSASVTGLQLCHSYSFLVQYRDRFRDKFLPNNLLHLNQMIFVVQKLMNKAVPSASPAEGDVVNRLSDFLLSTEIDNINIYTLLSFAERSRISNKLRGYITKFEPSVVIPEKKRSGGGVAAFLKSMQNKDIPPSKPPSRSEETEVKKCSGNPIPTVISFLEALTNHSEDGRVVCHVGPTPSESYLKFLLLNPAAHFKDVIAQARAVVLAGGTMQPFSEFTEQLFRLGGAPESRIKTFSCGHVVPPEHILPITVASGPTGRQLDFSYTQRSSTELLDDLGRLLVNVCNVVPAGMVVFYPSYDYEAKVFQYFSEKGIINKLSLKKKILREPKESSRVEGILAQYSDAAPKGALLFSVVGGKLSEGLNFSDDLGRCVIVVGLPYPNKTSPELREKMAYLQNNVGKDAGQVYYENLCMKAVNQSIGRSVRHQNDYASVLLLDHRYTRPRVVNALPQWIRTSLRSETQFGPVMAHLAKFFASKKRQNK